MFCTGAKVDNMVPSICCFNAHKKGIRIIWKVAEALRFFDPWVPDHCSETASLIDDDSSPSYAIHQAHCVSGVIETVHFTVEVNGTALLDPIG